MNSICIITSYGKKYVQPMKNKIKDVVYFKPHHFYCEAHLCTRPWRSVVRSAGWWVRAEVRTGTTGWPWAAARWSRGSQRMRSWRISAASCFACRTSRGSASCSSCEISWALRFHQLEFWLCFPITGVYIRTQTGNTRK